MKTPGPGQKLRSIHSVLKVEMSEEDSFITALVQERHKLREIPNDPDYETSSRQKSGSTSPR